MSVCLVGWGRFLDPKTGAKITVPAPSTDPDKPWLLDFLAKDVARLSRVGFTAIQLPPTGKAQGGAGKGCDGYGAYCRRDLGNLPQQGSVPTRYGTKGMLLDLVAMAHANGVDVYLDLVLHQLMGEDSLGTFKYLGADLKTRNGRGAMQPGCFRGWPIPPFRPGDDVPVPKDDFEFGRELVYQKCDPPGYTIADALDYGDWVFRTTDADGARFDDTKGTWAPFVRQFMTTGAMAGKWFVSEFFDGSPDMLYYWSMSPPMSGRSSVEDFTMHWALQAACDFGNVRGLHGAGFAARQPYKACTFVDNPDTDTSPGQQVINNKLLAYAFLLTVEGYPFVYGKDYYSDSVWPGAYGLGHWIDNLVWIHENLANGPTATRHLDNTSIVLNRTGSPGLLTGLNFGPNLKHVTCATSWPPNTYLHDYTGRHPDIWTDARGNATFAIPSNAYGRGQSYVCFGPHVPSEPVSRHQRPTTQTFFGAIDLDIMPARNNDMTWAGTVLSEAGRHVTLTLRPKPPGAWTPGATVTALLFDSNKMSLGGVMATEDDPTPNPADIAVPTAQRVSLCVVGSGLPNEGWPFELTARYTAPKSPI